MYILRYVAVLWQQFLTKTTTTVTTTAVITMAVMEGGLIETPTRTLWYYTNTFSHSIYYRNGFRIIPRSTFVCVQTYMLHRLHTEYSRYIHKLNSICRTIWKRHRTGCMSMYACRVEERSGEGHEGDYCVHIFDLLVFGWQSSKYLPFSAIHAHWHTRIVFGLIIPPVSVWHVIMLCEYICVAQDVLGLALNAKHFPIASWMSFNEWINERVNKSALFIYHSLLM